MRTFDESKFKELNDKRIDIWSYRNEFDDEYPFYLQFYFKDGTVYFDNSNPVCKLTDFLESPFLKNYKDIKYWWRVIAIEIGCYLYINDDDDVCRWVDDEEKNPLQKARLISWDNEEDELIDVLYSTTFRIKDYV